MMTFLFQLHVFLLFLTSLLSTLHGQEYECSAADDDGQTIESIMVHALSEMNASGHELETFICGKAINLIGPLPDDLVFYSQFTSLTSLTIRSRGMETSTLPSSFFQGLPTLTSLTLGNGYQGTIPTEIGLLDDLTALTFSESGLTGSLPLELTNCTTLSLLQVYSNPHMNGDISNILKMPSVSRFFMFDTNLQGTLPVELFLNRPIFFSFILRGNSFSGTIPSELSNVAEIHSCGLSFNRFVGTVPAHTCNSGLLAGSIFPTQSPTMVPNEMSSLTPTISAENNDKQIVAIAVGIVVPSLLAIIGTVLYYHFKQKSGIAAEDAKENQVSASL